MRNGKEDILIMSKVITILLLAAALVFTASVCSAAPAKQDKKGILIASFGTSMPEAKKAIDNLVNSTKKAFPDIEVRLSYTSNIIRKKIAKEQNLLIPTPMEALAEMNDDGFTHVYVMPMHIIPGEEYDDIKSLTEAAASIKGKYSFREIKLGRPFIADVPASDRMASILMKRFEKQLICIIDAIDHGTLVFRNPERQIILPSSRVFHWAKRYFEGVYLRKYR